MSRRNDSGSHGIFFLIFFLFVLRTLSMANHREHRSDPTQAFASEEPRIDYSMIEHRRGPDWGATAPNRELIENLIMTLRSGETENMLAYDAREDGSVQTVFLAKGNRITILWDGDKKLTFWVRKNGTHGGETLRKFIDNGLRGEPNYGQWFDENQSWFYDRESRQYLSNAEYWREHEGETLTSAVKALW
jgi:hypothetical protein